MALSGIQIYKLLPQTNCKDCGFPTCLAFAMKLAAKQVELTACPHVSDESKAQLSESAAPPVRLITLKADGHEVKVGTEDYPIVIGNLQLFDLCLNQFCNPLFISFRIQIKFATDIQLQA